MGYYWFYKIEFLSKQRYNIIGINPCLILLQMYGMRSLIGVFFLNKIIKMTKLSNLN